MELLVDRACRQVRQVMEGANMYVYMRKEAEEMDVIHLMLLMLFVSDSF